MPRLIFVCNDSSCCFFRSSGLISERSGVNRGRGGPRRSSLIPAVMRWSWILSAPTAHHSRKALLSVEKRNVYDGFQNFIVPTGYWAAMRS